VHRVGFNPRTEDIVNVFATGCSFERARASMRSGDFMLAVEQRRSNREVQSTVVANHGDQYARDFVQRRANTMEQASYLCRGKIERRIEFLMHIQHARLNARVVRLTSFATVSIPFILVDVP
jgi:hypothetical protein